MNNHIEGRNMNINWKNLVKDNLNNVRTKHPLVHNITNFVVMNSSANILLAQGAFPVMSHSQDEVQDMTSIANALVINIGTLTDYWVKSMIMAGKKANELGIPVIFDPVGAGATKFRTEKSLEIMKEVKVTVLRGNASEINALCSSKGKTRGVDSIHSVEDVMESAIKLALDDGLIIGISGEKDLITDGKQVVRVDNGVPLMTMVTGLGCGLSATVGAFVGANENPFNATVSAFSFYCIVGEIAYKNSNGPGTFDSQFRDALYNTEIDSLDKANILQ